MDGITGKELKERMKKSPVRTKETTVQEYKGPASEKRLGYVKEGMSFLETDGTAHQAVVFSTYGCDCGRLLNQKNSMTGTCQRHGCTRFTCSECVRTCTRCGRTFCPGHASIYRDGEIYCTGCKPVKWLKLFFGIGYEREKE